MVETGRNLKIMNEDINKLLKYWEITKESWNFNADELNKWDNISFSEKIELLVSTIEDYE